MFEKIIATTRIDPRNQWFWFNTLIYGFLIIVTTLYVYARLDYVRSYDQKTQYVTPEPTK